MAVEFARRGLPVCTRRAGSDFQPRYTVGLGDGVMARGWRLAHASVIGTSHEKTGTPCQDVAACRVVTSPGGSPVLLAIACDGAGSAPRSQDGAMLAARLFLEEFGLACAEEGVADISREFVLLWLDRLRAEIDDRAAADALRTRDFACTVLGAVIGEQRAAFFQIGDGAIVVSHRNEPNDYGWIFWPQHGQFANQTNFITQDDATDVLDFEASDCCIDEIALFTDGIERLVLDLRQKTAHGPFFRPLFGWLVGTKPASVDCELPASPILTGYLGSEQVNTRTDDDKTLILATRRVSPMAEEMADAAAGRTEAEPI